MEDNIINGYSPATVISTDRALTAAERNELKRKYDVEIDRLGNWWYVVHPLDTEDLSKYEEFIKDYLK